MILTLVRLSHRPAVAVRLAVSVLARINRLRGRPAETGVARLSEVVADLRAIRPSGRDWTIAVGLAAANWALDLACLAACCAAVGVHVGFPALLITYSAGMAAGSLLPLPAGLGAVETAMTVGLTVAGAAASPALAAVLLYRLLSTGSVVVLGWVVIAAQRDPERRDVIDRGLWNSKALGWIDRPSSVERPSVDSNGAVSGVDGNSRLTSATGIVLLVLLAVEGVTILSVRQMITLHVYVGVLLLGPVLLKTGSTMYRFARYYSGAASYVKKGPPHPVLRILGPFVILSSLALLGTGVTLIFLRPQHSDLMLTLHQTAFWIWVVLMTVHVLGHFVGAATPIVGRDSEFAPGQGRSAATVAVRTHRARPGAGRRSRHHPAAACHGVDQPHLRPSWTAATGCLTGRSASRDIVPFHRYRSIQLRRRCLGTRDDAHWRSCHAGWTAEYLGDLG